MQTTKTLYNKPQPTTPPSPVSTKHANNFNRFTHKTCRIYFAETYTEKRKKQLT